MLWTEPQIIHTHIEISTQTVLATCSTKQQQHLWLTAYDASVVRVFMMIIKNHIVLGRKNISCTAVLPSCRHNGSVHRIFLHRSKQTSLVKQTTETHSGITTQPDFAKTYGKTSWLCDSSPADSIRLAEKNDSGSFLWRFQPETAPNVIETRSI